MYRISFFTKLAFLCNLCFLAAVILQMMPHPPQGEMVATTIIIGYLFAVVVNSLANVWIAALFFLKKKSSHSVPRWLIIINFLFLIPQLIFIFK
jgi:hypothetical protein